MKRWVELSGGGGVAFFCTFLLHSSVTFSLAQTIKAIMSLWRFSTVPTTMADVDDKYSLGGTFDVKAPANGKHTTSDYPKVTWEQAWGQ